MNERQKYKYCKRPGGALLLFSKKWVEGPGTERSHQSWSRCVGKPTNIQRFLCALIPVHSIGRSGSGSWRWFSFVAFRPPDKLNSRRGAWGCIQLWRWVVRRHSPVHLVSLSPFSKHSEIYSDSAKCHITNILSYF